MFNPAANHIILARIGKFLYSAWQFQDYKELSSRWKGFAGGANRICQSDLPNGANWICQRGWTFLPRKNEKGRSEPILVFKFGTCSLQLLTAPLTQFVVHLQGLFLVSQGPFLGHFGVTKGPGRSPVMSVAAPWAGVGVGYTMRRRRRPGWPFNLGWGKFKTKHSNRVKYVCDVSKKEARKLTQYLNTPM